MDREHDRRAADERYIREVCDRIETPRGQRGKDMRGQAGKQKGVAVWRRARDRIRTDLPATASLIFHQEAMVEPFAEVLGNDVPKDIGSATSRERRYDPHGTAGPLLSKRWSREQEQ